MKKINKKQRFQVSIFGILLLFILSGIFSISNPYKIAVKAETQNIDSFSNPLVLLEIPGEIKIEFQTGIYVGAESDFQVGEKIMVLLRGYLLRGGSFPVIAEKTYYIISNSTGDVIWSRDMSTIGGGWWRDSGGRWERGTNWIPEKEGNYTAGIIFIQPFYENLQNNTNAVPFRVHNLGSILGIVTEVDTEIAIEGALVEAYRGIVYSNTTTNSEGLFNLQTIPSGIYDIKVSKPGYKSFVHEFIKADYKIVNINFSLTLNPVTPNDNSTLQDDNLPPEPSPSPELEVSLPSTIQTSAYIELEPKTVEVNQEVLVNMIIEPTLLTSECFEGLVLTIVDPSGHTYVKGPYSTNSDGTQSILYIPTMSGTYTFQLSYRGQIFNNKESEYTSSTSSIVTLTVNGLPETVDSSDSVQNQTNTSSTIVDIISIQSSSDDSLLNSTMSSASVNESSVIPIQNSDAIQTAPASTLEIVGIVLVVIFGIGLLVNLVKKRRKN